MQCQNTASAWPLEKTTQSINTKSIMWWLCSCHVRSVQKTNMQTITSKFWGDISWGFFFLFLLKCMEGECLGSCDCSIQQQFTSECAHILRWGKQGMIRELVPQKDSAQAPLVRNIRNQPVKEKYIHTCSRAHVQYSVAINNKDNRQNRTLNSIVIWKINKIK